MVYEWTKVFLFGQNNDGQQVQYSIADGIAVSKGTLMALHDPFTCSKALVGDTVYAGVTADEVCASDNPVNVSLWTQGIFEATCSGAVGLGSAITGSTDNTVKSTTTASGAVSCSGAMVLGWTREEGSDGEVINVRLNL